MRYVILLGRILYSAIFLMSAHGNFPAATIAYSAGKGVPLASIAVPLSGAIAFFGGLSILLGFKARYGAWLIVIFLVPVTLVLLLLLDETLSLLDRVVQFAEGVGDFHAGGEGFEPFHDAVAPRFAFGQGRHRYRVIDEKGWSHKFRFDEGGDKLID